MGNKPGKRINHQMDASAEESEYFLSGSAQSFRSRSTSVIFYNEYMTDENMKNSTAVPAEDKSQKKIKWGAALGGGGSRGSYTMGVLQALTQCGYKFDMVTGVSIGALTGAGYVMQETEGLQEWINEFKQDMVVNNPFVFPNQNSIPKLKEDEGARFMELFSAGGPSIQPLIDAYSRIFNFEAFKNSPIDFACLTYNVTENRPVVFYKKDMNTDDVLLKLMSSTAYFPAFNFVPLNGCLYADGSYCDVPLGQVVHEMGADKIVAVELHNAEENGQTIAQPVNLLIRPILNLKNYLDFDPEDLKNQIAQGYLEGLKYLNQAPGYIYTFYKEDELAFRALTRAAEDVIKKSGQSVDQKMLIDGISTLLGYRPQVLNNELMKNYTAGLVLEILGLIAGLSPYKQYHVMDFTAEVLKSLEEGKIQFGNASRADAGVMTDLDGARELMRFFRAGLKSFDGKLPPQFDCFKKKFISLYYLALAWTVLEKFTGVFDAAELIHDLDPLKKARDLL